MVKDLDKEFVTFKYLHDFILKLSAAKVKAGVFIEPQIKRIIKSKKLPRTEKAAWNSVDALVRGFLGNHKTEKYVIVVEYMMKNYSKMDCRMLTLILINSTRTWLTAQRSKTSAASRIYWALNAAIKHCITKI